MAVSRLFYDCQQVKSALGGEYRPISGSPVGGPYPDNPTFYRGTFKVL